MGTGGLFVDVPGSMHIMHQINQTSSDPNMSQYIAYDQMGSQDDSGALGMCFLRVRSFGLDGQPTQRFSLANSNHTSIDTVCRPHKL